MFLLLLLLLLECGNVSRVSTVELVRCRTKNEWEEKRTIEHNGTKGKDEYNIDTRTKGRWWGGGGGQRLKARIAMVSFFHGTTEPSLFLVPCS